MTYRADWYPDPLGRYELRYWDGEQWTDHVATQGVQGSDPLAAALAQQAQEQAQKQAQEQAQRGGGTILTEPILVVSQVSRPMEAHDEYAVCDQYGRQIGAVREVSQGPAKKRLRLFGSGDQLMTHTLQVADRHGQVLLQIGRSATMFKSRVVVQDGEGHEIGQILQQNVWGKIRFSLECGGQQYGAVNAENWQAWDFDVQDRTGTEVARITKAWAGLATARNTPADSYAVQIHRQLDEPLRSLVVAAGLAIDTALAQDAGRGAD